MEQLPSQKDLLAEVHALKASLEEEKRLRESSEAELTEVQYRLEEANDMIEAIRLGEVDALVVKADDGHQLYTLRGSDLAYRIFIEQMTSGAVTLNRQGDIMYSNTRFASILNLPLEKVTGQPFCNFVEKEKTEDCAKLIEQAWETGSRKEIDLVIAGVQVPVLLSMQTIDLAEGLFLSVIVTDLTQQKEQQKQLEVQNVELARARRIAEEMNRNLEETVRSRTKELYSNQERLSRILETMAEGVGIIDLDGHLTYANPMAQKILGLVQAPYKELSYTDPNWPKLRVDGTPLPEDEHPMTVTLRTGKPIFDFEVAIQPPDKDRFYISINAAPIRDEQGNIIGGIGTFMDVTNRRKSIQQKDEFISVASHELKTPITSLKAALQLLDRMKDNPNQQIFPKLIEQSNKSLDKVSVLINDLLNVTKLAEGQLSLNKTRFTLAALVAECCPHIRSEGHFHIIGEGDDKLFVDADRDKIDQVLTNLVNNAVKYAPDSKTIVISYRREGQMALISVTDQGPGIPEAKLPFLFERYYRVDEGGHQYSGLGLGLYICSEIVKKHGGQMGVESQVGEGSTFWFTLPLE